MLYNINSLKVGLKIIQNKEPCVIIANECVKPGKGKSFNRVRFKQIISGKILEKTLKSGEFLESADILEIKLIFLYKSKNLWYFMDGKNFDQTSIHHDVIGESSKWITEQSSYVVTFWNKEPILVTVPEYVDLMVTKTVGISKAKGVFASSKNKLATLSTGVIIKVPFFIRTGELVKINTHFGSYISRVK